jgi:hypothetical protein
MIATITFDLVASLILATEGGAPWTESARYAVRLGEIKTCTTAATTTTSAPGRVWVGIDAQVKANDDKLFVTARDFSLVSAGMILDARHVNPPLLPGCLPLLAPTQLSPKATTHGFVLFEMPASWKSSREALVLAYRPTRWGGARRLEIRIPRCLDACPDTPAPATRKKVHGSDRK